MSEQQDTESQNGTQDPGDATQVNEAEEKAILLGRLRFMGLNPSNNAKVETLRRMLEDAQNGNKEPQDETPAVVQPMPGQPLTPAQQAASAPTPPTKTLAQYLRDEYLALVRVRITNMDPKKKDLQGEIITVGNNHIGTIKKFVPYGEATDGGYHIPKIIYNLLKNREFVDIRTTTHPVTKQIIVKTRMAKEFGIEVLDPLTPAQLQKLATAQMAANSVEQD